MDAVFWQAILDADGAVPAGHAVEDPAHTAAYHNARNFVRSLYVQLALGVRTPSYHPNPAYFQRAPVLRDELLPLVAGALRTLDPGFYAQAS
jgi:hypothetical protein